MTKTNVFAEMYINLLVRMIQKVVKKIVYKIVLLLNGIHAIFNVFMF